MRRKKPSRPGAVENELATAQQRAQSTLEALPTSSRAAGYTLFSAAPAERLFRWYDTAPEETRRPYSQTWRPVLDDIWSHLAGDDTAFTRVSNALGKFYLSPYSNNNQQDGPDDIDQDEAAATFFAANCLMHGMVNFALLSSARATDHIDAVWCARDDDRL